MFQISFSGIGLEWTIMKKGWCPRAICHCIIVRIFQNEDVLCFVKLKYDLGLFFPFCIFPPNLIMSSNRKKIQIFLLPGGFMKSVLSGPLDCSFTMGQPHELSLAAHTDQVSVHLWTATYVCSLRGISPIPFLSHFLHPSPGQVLTNTKEPALIAPPSPPCHPQARASLSAAVIFLPPPFGPLS